MVTVSREQQDAIRNLMHDSVSSGNLPPLYVAVSDRNGEIFMHQESSTSYSLPEDTVFWICSQTKLITSIAALQLIERGMIQLDTRVSDILPELAEPSVQGSPAKHEITFGQLLNHTSGLKYTTSGPSYGAQVYQSNSEFLAKIRGSGLHQSLKFEPGTDFAYGYSTDCMGFIIEKLSGQTLERYFEDNIFSPLGISSASFYLTPALKARSLPLHFRDGNNEIILWDHQTEIINQDPETLKVHLGGVGLYASLQDYLALLRHLLQIQANKATQPIMSKTSCDALFDPTLNEKAANSLAKMLGLATGQVQFSCGLMIEMEDKTGRRKKGSGSWAGYACTSHFVDPTTGIAVVFGTQLLPSGDYDLAYERLWMEIEAALYKGLTA
ncbi:Acyltransferase mlcH [Mycena indigotica]|uniref:Acyltransferase mlcH n=1 Tax=Mycena indigotica TaxID=2126181 RepID=A0A8H6SGL7_9AGAR|nr:Acyltransferase mlcH [Mycena indigotica]KAF7299121.1 Acyltransferase mlcH [Mycena indigotica]